MKFPRGNSCGKTPVTPPLKTIAPFLKRMFAARWIGWLAAGIVLASLVAYYPDVADDFDVWWHLKYGEHFVRHLTWTIDHSVFSWTPSNPSWVYITWIGSSLLYLIHAAGGYTALVVMQWLIFFAMTGLFFIFRRSCKLPLSVVHLAGLLLVFTAMNPIAVYIKPESFSMLFFTVAVFFYFLSKIYLKSYYWVYPPLFLVWVNTHGGFINGLAFITFALAAEAICYAFKHPDRMLKSVLLKFAGCVALSYAAALINPHGAAYWMNIMESAAQSGSHIHSITAYSPLWIYLFPTGFPFRKTNTAWAMIIMVLVLFALAGAGLIRRKQLSPPVLMLNLIFFILGFSLFRASIYFCILWIFSCHYLGRLGQWRLNLPASITAFLFSLAVAGMIIYETVALLS